MLIVMDLKVQTLKCLCGVKLQARAFISSFTYLLKKNSQAHLFLRHSSDFSNFFFLLFKVKLKKSSSFIFFYLL